MAKSKNYANIKLISICAVIVIAIIGALVNGRKGEQANTDKSSDSVSSTQIHFADIGQGDATLVVSDGEAMLIDCGDTDTDDRLVAYMKKQGVESLKYMVITHPHADHMGEAKDVLKNFKTEKIIMPKVPENMAPTSYVYEKFLKEVKNQGLKITAASDTEFTLGKCRVQLFTPKKDYDDLNNYSTLVKITENSKSFLITGDCETDKEKDIMEQGFDIDADVLKVGHHGSRTSSSQKFLDAVSPDIAVISCGEGNKYGHPHSQTVKRLQKCVSDIYVTMDNGSVVISIDGGELKVRTERNDKK